MKILVPIDFSKRSEKALRVADKFAALFNGKVTPLHSHVPISEVDEPYALGMGSHTYQNLEELETNLSERAEEISSGFVDENRLDAPLIVMGNPAQTIIEVSDDFDYIIMSSHGRTGFSRFLLGSVSEKVLRLSHTPVMVVENESEVGDFKKILVTTDFSDNASHSYPYALKIAQKTGAGIDLLHVLSYDQIDEQKADLSIKNLREKRLEIIEKEYFHEIPDKVSTKLIVSTDSVHEALFNHVKENPYNLIVMSTVGRTGINYLMLGSTTANLVRHVKTAVLSINPRR